MASYLRPIELSKYVSAMDKMSSPSSVLPSVMNSMDVFASVNHSLLDSRLVNDSLESSGFGHPSLVGDLEEAQSGADNNSTSQSLSTSVNSRLQKQRKRKVPEDGNSDITPKPKSRRRASKQETLPGTSLKICSSCGTVAETAKAKKCQSCQKFFYEHWAQRCRVPPCPKCYFSRRARAKEKPPFTCDRCGFDLSSPEQLSLLSPLNDDYLNTDQDSTPNSLLDNLSSKAHNLSGTLHADESSDIKHSELNQPDVVSSVDPLPLDSNTKSDSQWSPNKHHDPHKSVFPYSGGVDSSSYLYNGMLMPGESKIALVQTPGNDSSVSLVTKTNHSVTTCSSEASVRSSRVFNTPSIVSMPKNTSKLLSTGLNLEQPCSISEPPAVHVAPPIQIPSMFDSVNKQSGGLDSSGIYTPASLRDTWPVVVPSTRGLSSLHTSHTNLFQTMSSLFNSAAALSHKKQNESFPVLGTPKSIPIQGKIIPSTNSVSLEAVCVPNVPDLSTMKSETPSPFSCASSCPVPDGPVPIMSQVTPTMSPAVTLNNGQRNEVISEKSTPNLPIQSVPLISNLQNTLQSDSSGNFYSVSSFLPKPLPYSVEKGTTSPSTPQSLLKPLPHSVEKGTTSPSTPQSLLKPLPYSVEKGTTSPSTPQSLLKPLPYSVEKGTTSPSTPQSLLKPLPHSVEKGTTSPSTPQSLLKPLPYSVEKGTTSPSTPQSLLKTLPHSTEKVNPSSKPPPNVPLSSAVGMNLSPSVSVSSYVPKLPTVVPSSALTSVGRPATTAASPTQAMSQLLKYSQNLGLSLSATDLSNAPPLKKIKEFVDMTLKQQQKQQQHKLLQKQQKLLIEQQQQQALFQKQRKLLVDQLQTQIQIQQSIISSHTSTDQQNSSKNNCRKSSGKAKHISQSSESASVESKRVKKDDLSTLSELVSEVIQCMGKESESGSSTPQAKTETSKPSGVSVGIQTVKSKHGSPDAQKDDATLTCSEKLVDNVSTSSVEKTNAQVDVTHTPTQLSNTQIDISDGSSCSTIDTSKQQTDTDLAQFFPTTMHTTSLMTPHTLSPPLSTERPGSTLLDANMDLPSSPVPPLSVQSSDSNTVSGNISADNTTTFRKIEVGTSSGYQIPGHDKIRVSLLKQPPLVSSLSCDTFSTGITTKQIDSVPTLSGGVAKFQNFSLSHPKLSVIATVEARSRPESEPFRGHRSLFSHKTMPIVTRDETVSKRETASTTEGCTVSKVPEIFEKLASTIQTTINALTTAGKPVTSESPELPRSSPSVTPTLTPSIDMISGDSVPTSNAIDDMSKDLPCPPPLTPDTDTSNPMLDSPEATSGQLPITNTQDEPDNTPVPLSPPQPVISSLLKTVTTPSNETPPVSVAPSSKQPSRSGVVTVQVCSTLPSAVIKTASTSTVPKNYPNILRPRMAATATIGNVLVQNLQALSPKIPRTSFNQISSNGGQSTMPKGGVYVSVLGGTKLPLGVKGQGMGDEGKKMPLKGQTSHSSGRANVMSPSHTLAESDHPHKTEGGGESSSHNGEGSGDGGNCEDGGAGEGSASCDGVGDGHQGMGEEDRGKKDKEDEPKKKKAKRAKSSPSKKKKEKMKIFSVKLKDGFLHHLMWNKHRVVFLVPLNERESKPPTSSSQNGSVKQGERSGQSSSGSSKGTKSSPAAGGNRKTRRKAKLEPLVMHEMEEELDPFLESPSTSSAHINTPCFSIYELRHKVFSDFASNAVYAFTYRNQIKTLRSPLHWHYVLKRMGGVHSSCRTCRLLEYKNVRRMCEHQGIDSSIPSILDDLSQNKIPKGRKVIDLSDLDPEDLLTSLEHLDEIPQCSFASPKKKKSSVLEKSSPPQDELDESFDGSTSKLRNESCDQSPDRQPADSELSTPPQMRIKSHDQSHESQDDSSAVFLDDSSHVTSKKSVPPPLIKLSPLSSRSNPNKKKFCPECGVQIARKSKKCYACGKRFGIFSFGRRICPSCGRCNLARMTACFGCGHTLADAPTAIPEGVDEAPPVHQRPSFPFGSRKRPRPLGYHSNEGGSSTKIRKEQYHSISSSAPSSRLPSLADTEASLDQSEDFPFEEGGVVNEPEIKMEPPTTPNRVTPSHKPTKHSGYQYGRIPWGEADVTCLVDESGTPKFCLPELCTKVLRTHSKADVFEIVKDLNLPLSHGDLSLLKRLQALGLHSNRSPLCRLIAAEELWALLDALQEQVPVEVHHHLETISISTTPLLSPGGVASSQSPAIVQTSTAITEEEEHGFESTLHEVQCSDGQCIALLRTWNGDQYGSLTEIWRKYFPEVNRNHLTSALKRLKLETNMPTGQQATLLRNANVISLRGAAGRLMKFEDMQILLDDFSIPLQIGSSLNSKMNKAPPPLPQPLPPPPVSRPRKNSSYGLSHAGLVASAAAQGKVIATKEDLQYAECMRNLLKAVDPNDLTQLLEKAHKEAAATTSTVDDDNRAAASSDLDEIQQLIFSRRDLCGVISNEIGYLTVTNHGFMSEAVRIAHTERLVLIDLDRFLKSFNINL